MRILGKTVIRFFSSFVFFFLLLNILLIPILLATGPQGGGWYFSIPLFQHWNTLVLLSLILSILYVHLYLRNIRSLKKALLPEILVFLMGSFFLYGTLFLLPKIDLGIAPPPTGTYRIASPNRIFYTAGSYLWVGNSEGWILKPVLILTLPRIERPIKSDRIKVFPEATFVPETNSLHLLELGANVPLHERIQIQEPWFSRIFAENLTAYTRLLTPKTLLDTQSLQAILAFVFCLVSLLSLMRLTQWVVFNYLVSFSVPLLVIGSVPFLREIANIPFVEYVPTFLPGALGLLLWIFQFFQSPVQRT